MCSSRLLGNQRAGVRVSRRHGGFPDNENLSWDSGGKPEGVKACSSHATQVCHCQQGGSLVCRPPWSGPCSVIG